MKASLQSPLPDQALDRALAFGGWLLTSVQTFAAQLDLSDAGEIELPPISGSATDQAHLRVAAPLYLACELEFAQLLPTVETLAGLFVNGGLHTDVGEAAPMLAAFWQSRHQRFSVQERRAMFTHLFGESFGPNSAELPSRTPSYGAPAYSTRRRLAQLSDGNAQFEALMVDLTEALYKFDPSAHALLRRLLRGLLLWRLNRGP